MSPLLVLLAALLAMPQAPRHSQYEESILCTFEARVTDYVMLHRRLEQSLPPRTEPDDLSRLFALKHALAAEIRRERVNAKPGDIFAPEIAALFRRLVDRTLRDHSIDMIAILTSDEDEPMSLIDVRVNADYPAGGPVSFMPPQLLQALPPLPPELQYRFANFDLILWDVHAELIVDFVPDVFRRITAPVPDGSVR